MKLVDDLTSVVDSLISAKPDQSTKLTEVEVELHELQVGVEAVINKIQVATGNVVSPSTMANPETSVTSVAGEQHIPS